MGGANNRIITASRLGDRIRDYLRLGPRQKTISQVNVHCPDMKEDSSLDVSRPVTTVFTTIAKSQGRELCRKGGVVFF